jgi:hypothetical protein
MVNSENQHEVYSGRDTGSPQTLTGMRSTVYRLPSTIFLLSPFTIQTSPFVAAGRGILVRHGRKNETNEKS